MSFTKLIPRMCAACTLLGLLAATSAAQDMRPRIATTTATDARGTFRLENEPAIVSLAPEEDFSTAESSAPSLRLSGLKLSLMNAIDARLGTPYRLGSEGPWSFDCSGFVWSVFQQAGIDFERGSARTLWSRFAPASDEEKFKFGTLVFFNNLNHVGIVADEGGFFHASSSRGVVYSPFNEYWTRRIVGFRRVPLSELEAAKVAALNAPTK